MNELINFATFWVLALSGVAAALLLMLVVFSKSTNQLQNKETFDKWWVLNAYFVYACLIIVTALSFLLTVPGGDWLVNYLSGGKLDGTKPFGFYMIAFLMGLLIQFVIDKIRGIVMPIQVDTRTLPKTGE